MRNETRQMIGQAVLETLETRRMMSSVQFADGVLIVQGSELQPNELSVHVSTDGAKLWAVANNKTSKLIDASSVRQIRIVGGEKSDTVSVDVAVKIPVYVQTGNGRDFVTTGSGNDVIFTGNGRDTVNAGPGNDKVNAGNGNDEISAGAGDDAVDGGNGSDLIAGGRGSDTLQGQSGDDSIGASTGNDLLSTGLGTDLGRGGPGQDTILGGKDDNLNGDDGNDVLDRNFFPSKGVENDPDDTDGDTGPDDSNNNSEEDDGAANGDGGETSTETPQTVKSFSLINADTDEIIEGYTNIKGPISIDLADLPTRRLNLRANFENEFKGSVWFGLNEIEKFTIENTAPFSFKHDLYGDYYNWSPKAGVYHITAQTFSGKFGTGAAGEVVGVKITFTDSDTPKEEPNNGSSGNSGNGGSNNSGNTDNDDNSGTIISDGAGKDAPNAVLKLITSGNVQEGHSVHVSAMESDLKGGSMLGMKYEWDFGDTGSKYNKLRGFNAAHIYEKPGKYTVTLKVTDSKGRSDTAKVTVNIAESTRRVIYVSTDGDDNNNGLAPALAVRTLAKAESMVRDNTEILLRRGDRFNINDSFIVDAKSNVVIGSYGTNKKGPVVNWSGAKPSKDRDMITVRNGTNVTVRDLTFDSPYTTKGKNYLTSVRPSGTNVTVLNNTFLNVTEGINSNFQPTGLLVQGNDAPTFLRGGFSWCSGFYLVYLGNHLEDSSQENGMRVSGAGTKNLLFAYNDLRNTYKGSLVIQKSSHVYVYGNILRGQINDDGDGGKVELGPLGKNTGALGADQRTKWVVFEDNLITEHSQIQLHHGLENVVVRNNVIKTDDLNAISIDGYSRKFDRSVKKAMIHNNTVINNGDHGRFLWMGGPANDISLLNNLYVAPKIEVGKYSAAAVYVQQSDLRSFRTIDGNVWPTPSKTGGFYGDSINFLGTTNIKANYQSAVEWNALDNVGTDTFKNVTLTNTYSTKAGGEVVGAPMAK